MKIIEMKIRVMKVLLKSFIQYWKKIMNNVNVDKPLQFKTMILLTYTL